MAFVISEAHNFLFTNSIFFRTIGGAYKLLLTTVSPFSYFFLNFINGFSTIDFGVFRPDCSSVITKLLAKIFFTQITAPQRWFFSLANYKGHRLTRSTGICSSIIKLKRKLAFVGRLCFIQVNLTHRIASKFIQCNTEKLSTFLRIVFLC